MFEVTIKGSTFEEFQRNVLDHAALFSSTALASGTVKPAAEVKTNASLDAAGAKQIAGSTATVVEPKATTAKAPTVAEKAAAAEEKAAKEKAAKEKAAKEKAEAEDKAQENAVSGGTDPLGDGAADETAYTMEDTRKALMEYRALLPQAQQVQSLASLVKTHGGSEKLVDADPSKYGAIIKAAAEKIAELSI